MRTSKTTAQRFPLYVNKTEGCWLWTGAVHGNGYGGMWPNLLAHRVAWELEYGPIPDGKLVLHRCDVRTCVRPDHLFLGTHDDNMTDAIARRYGVGETAIARIAKGLSWRHVL